MSELSEDEKFLLNVIRDNGNKISYKELNNICSEKFEGVRLVLKKLKSSGFVNFEGIIPSFSSEIELNKDSF
ncbi:MAG: hypothetical protein ACTSRB_01260 [Candidatus Helarchaeota archaeon]